MFQKYLEKPVRYDLLDRWIQKNSSLKILDIGCGNHSASITKRYYPECLYYGLDINKNFNNDENDFQAMESFYEIDLNNSISSLDVLPNKFFDLIILSHIIEHLNDDTQVLNNLCKKIKLGGFIYIETPSTFTARFPNMSIGLNFYSDPTHIEVKNIGNIDRLLDDNGFTVLREGKRRSLKRIIFLPVYFLVSLHRNKRISPAVFWDIIGWSYYIIARK